MRLLDGRISKTQVGALEELTFTPHFTGLADHMQDSEDRWIAMFDHPLAETVVPEPWMKGDDVSMTNKVAQTLKKLIVIKILRPDRLLAAVDQLLASALGQEITSINPVDLAEFAGPKISPKNPIMLVSAPGFDASYKVELLAK